MVKEWLASYWQYAVLLYVVTPLIGITFSLITGFYPTFVQALLVQGVALCVWALCTRLNAHAESQRSS